MVSNSLPSEDDEPKPTPIISEWWTDSEGRFMGGDAEAWLEDKKRRDYELNWS